MNTDELIIFYRKLADYIENRKLSIEKLLTVGEMQRAFFCKDKMETGIVLQDKQIETYLFTGWYIYSMMDKA